MSGNPTHPNPSAAELEEEQDIETLREHGVDTRTSYLASKYLHFVPQGEELNLLGLFAPKEQESQPKQLSDAEVDEGPQLTTGPVPSHRVDGSRDERCSAESQVEGRSGSRTLRDQEVAPHPERLSRAASVAHHVECGNKQVVDGRDERQPNTEDVGLLEAAGQVIEAQPRRPVPG
jgi:hypothetical protein